MPSNQLPSYRLATSFDDNVQILEKVRARIEELNLEDHQAIVRSQQERDRWLQAREEMEEDDILSALSAITVLPSS